MPDSISSLEGAKDLVESNDDTSLKRTALVTGSVALGAFITSSLFRRIKHLELKAPLQLRPAIDADADVMECMEGSVRFYHRDGSGIPLVLLHSINAAASSYEMKPVFDYFAERTNRPIFALDWLGFGRSDRPPVRYSSEIYERHLRRFLSEHVHQPADIVALSLAGEYAAEVAHALPYLVNRVVLISPTGLAEQETTSAWQKSLIAAASRVGAFEIFFYRLTRAEMLRSFYERQVFRSDDVPADLVDYARDTTLVFGAHYAPRYFIQGDLRTGRKAADVYAHLQVPALLVLPQADEGLVQRFDRIGEIESRGHRTTRIERIAGGLMPQWENADALFRVLDEFLNSEDAQETT